MANLKTFSGFPIQNLTSDPTPYAQAIADNPYQGTWASGGNMNTARKRNPGAGTQTSSVVAGGDDGGTTPTFTDVEEYNGTSWTEIAEINEGNSRQSCAGANAEAILEIGGEAGTKATCESWNGSAWTEVGDLNTGRYDTAAGGTYTSAIVAAGSNATTYQAVTETWNGSSWTETGDLNTARQAIAGDGTTTAMIVAGGTTGSNVAVSETFNGSTWTEVNDLNTARHFFSGAGSTTDIIVMGGNPRSTITENYNGSSWSEVNDMANARDENLGRAGTGTTALMAGGNGNPGGTNLTATEEWSFSGLPPSTPAADYSDAIIGQMYYNSTTGQFKAIKDGGQPVGTWASASGINTGRSYFAGAGTATDSIVFGGYVAPTTTEDTEIWNGSSWTEVSNLNEAPYYNMAGSGASSTAALCYSGQGGGVRKNNAESWDGSSWTEITGLNTGRSGAAGVGPQTAAMCFGGNTYNPPPSVVYQALTEIWNGSSWTEVNDLNTARGDIAPVGSVYTDVLAVSGGAPNKTNNESFNGTSWTELADTNTTASSRSGSGVPAGPTAIVSGGYAPGVTANTEAWDGSSWTETGDLATARGKSAESASSTTGFQVGGETPSTPKNTNVEQFSFDDFDITTLTTS